MNVTDMLRVRVNEFSGWGDVLAVCYVLFKSIVRDEGLFAAQYLGDGRDGHVVNPNLPTLQALEDNVRDTVCSELEGYRGHREALASVILTMDAMTLIDYGDEAQNHATILWKVIKGIDEGYASCDLTDYLEVRGPINSSHANEVGVYLRALARTPLRLAYASARSRAVPDPGLNNKLKAVIFYRKEQGRHLPTVVLADAGLNSGPSAIAVAEDSGTTLAARKHSVAIGLELFTGVDVFSDRVTRDPLLCKDYTMGSAFGIKYATGYEETVRDLIRESIDSAITRGCQILVFPEMVISPRLSEEISRMLRDEERFGRLSLVVAGSGWQECESGGDNICYLYDGFGRLLGTYHKRSAFLPNNREGEDYEALTHPALTCTIVDIKGLGRVLPSICKDLGSNDRYTSRLATTFDSDLVCVPALSTSLEKVFDDQLHTLANRAYSHCVICNLCGARHEYPAKVGQTLPDGGALKVALIGHPVPSSSNPSNMDCEHVGITRSHSCHDRCASDFAGQCMRSCLHVVRIDPDRSGNGTVLSIVEPSHKQ